MHQHVIPISHVVYPCGYSKIFFDLVTRIQIQHLVAWQRDGRKGVDVTILAHTAVLPFYARFQRIDALRYCDISKLFGTAQQGLVRCGIARILMCHIGFQLRITKLADIA